MTDSASEIATRTECLRPAVKIAEVASSDADTASIVTMAKAFYDFAWTGATPRSASTPDDEIPF